MSALPAGSTGFPRTPWEIQRAVVFALLLRELRTRVGSSWTGVLWMLFEPFGHVLVMVTVFGFLRAAVSPNFEYPVYLATGLVPFFLFRNLVLRLMDAVDANLGLFAYRQVKPFDTYLARALLELIMYGTIYLVTLLLLGWLGFQVVPQQPLELAAVTALLVLLGIALGVLFGVATHERPKARYTVRLAFLPLYLMSGVVIPITSLPEMYREILLWNPALHLVELTRQAFVAQHRLIQGIGHELPLAVLLVALALGLALYRVNRLRLLSVH